MESDTNSDDSITFRSSPLENDDRRKNIVKIEPDYMIKLGIKEGTSKSQFSKAKKYLYRHLNEFFDAEIISSYEKRTS